MLSVLRGSEQRREALLLGLLVLLATVPTVLTWTDVPTCHPDSYEYMHGARTLYSGKSYLALEGSVQTKWAPGYSLVIGAVNILLGDLELSGKLVSVLSSIGAVMLLYLLGRRWLSSTAALWGALFFAFLPLRVASSQWIMSDPLFVALVLLAFYLYSVKNTVGAGTSGLVLGAAYLVRHEALLVTGGLWLLEIVCYYRDRTWERLKRILAIVIPVLAVVIAYVLWLHAVTGKWTLSNKTWTFAVPGLWDKGVSHAFLRVLDPDTNRVILTTGEEWTASTFLGHYLRNLLDEKNKVFYLMGPEPVVSLSLLLGITGSIIVAWKAHKFRGLAMQFVLCTPLLLFPLIVIPYRWLLQVTPVFSLWLGQGVVETRAWVEQQTSLFLPSRTARRASLGVVTVMVIAVLLSYGYRIVSWPPYKACPAQKVVGEWLSAQALPSGAIMTEHPSIAFYAGMTHRWLVNAPADKVVDYARSTGVRYIVVSTKDPSVPIVRALTRGHGLPEGIEYLHEISAGEDTFLLYFIKTSL